MSEGAKPQDHSPARHSRERFEGCLLGLALGDALGAPYEGGLLERWLWRLLGTTRQGAMRWTDDTQMSLDLAESLVAQGVVDPDDLARRFAASYRWSRGYGPGAAKLLKSIARGADWREASLSVYPDGSFGNGGAMRVPVVGLFYATRVDELPTAARESAQVTHAHPLGLEGAVMIAAATGTALASGDRSQILEAAAAACALNPFKDKLEIVHDWLESGQVRSAQEVRTQLGNGMAAPESCVTALYLALRFLDDPFLQMLKFIAGCGGDVDTIGAMAGALWGTVHGVSALPADAMSRLEQRERLLTVAGDLHVAFLAMERGGGANQA